MNFFSKDRGKIKYMKLISPQGTPNYQGGLGGRLSYVKKNPKIRN